MVVSARLRLLGVDYFVGDLPSAAATIVRRGLAGDGGYVVCCNVHVLTSSQRIAPVRRALEAAWLVLPDGAPVAWLQRRAGAETARRIAGPDLMLAVLAGGRSVGLKHFLFGSTTTVLESLTRQLDKLVPGVQIVGRYSPGPGAEDSREALSSIRSAEPHIVWVALGAPRQELWMRRHADEFEGLAVGVGAAFDFLAGTKRRAPTWIQESGLEWLHRLVSEPRRLGPRYLQTNPSFVLLTGRELLRRKWSKARRRVSNE